MADDKLLNMAEIGRRLRPPISRERVRVLSHREDFPRPRVDHGRVVLWDRAAVATWARASGRRFA